MLFEMLTGVIPCSALYASWIALLRDVSSMVERIESVSLSAYRITRPFTFLAARPMVWINERTERRKPSLSASRIATKDTSGMSNPSRRRLIPTSTSKVPSRNSRINSIRSITLISLWR